MGYRRIFQTNKEKLYESSPMKSNSFAESKIVKFQYFYEHNNQNYYKNIYAELTIILIKNMLIKFLEKREKLKNISIHVKNKDGKILLLKKSINETLLLSGIIDELINDMFDGKLTDFKLKSFISTHIITQINEQDRSFIRKSKRSFTKWYVKQYHEVYKQKKKIYDNLLKNNEIDSNTKLKIKEMKIKIKQAKKEFDELLKNQLKT